MLKVMTLNVANYDGHPHWPARLKLLADAIVRSRADIIALQEIRFNPAHPTTQPTYQNTAEQILSALNDLGVHRGSRVVFQPAMFYGSGHPTNHYPLPGEHPQLWEGLAIISALPVVEMGARFLTQPADTTDRNRRMCLHAAVARDGGLFYLFNTHFGLDSSARESNVGEILAYIARGERSPSLLVGDMNAAPDDPCLAPLAGSGLTDLWNALHPNRPGLTFPSPHPDRRIDYCWTNAALLPSVHTIEIVADTETDGIYPSDHLGLVTTLAI